jgi:hypothetical protein
MPKEDFKKEVEKELPGKETEPWEITYFKPYQTQMPIIEKAIETAALMLGSDRSRGSIRNRMRFCSSTSCVGMAGAANRVAVGRTWKSITDVSEPLRRRFLGKPDHALHSMPCTGPHTDQKSAHHCIMMPRLLTARRLWCDLEGNACALRTTIGRRTV